MPFEEAVAECNAKSGDKVQINLLIGPWRPNARCCPQGGEAMGLPETREFLCRWAKRVGLDTVDAVRDSPLHEGAAAFRAKCGAIVDLSPYAAGVQRTSNH